MKKKVVLLISISLLIIGLIGLISYFVINKENNKEKFVVKVLEKIDGYNYVLEDRDNDIYKTEYFLLKQNLESDVIDYQKYASSIAKMFVIDLYTIDNKLNKYDVGGTDFLIKDYVDNFELQVEDSLYKYIEDNTYETRKQVLPIVSEVIVDSIEEKEFILSDVTYPSYEVKLSWKYTAENDYDKSGVVTIINKDKTLYVVAKSNEAK